MKIYMKIKILIILATVLLNSTAFASDPLYLLGLDADDSVIFNQLKKYFIKRYEADQFVDLKDFEKLYRKCNPYGNVRSHIERGYVDFCLEKTYTNFSAGVGTFSLSNQDKLGRKLTLSSVSYFVQAKVTIPTSLSTFYSLEGRYYYLPSFVNDMLGVNNSFEVTSYAKIVGLRQQRFQSSDFSYRLGPILTRLPIPKENSTDNNVANSQIEMQSLVYGGFFLGFRYVPSRDEGIRHAFTLDYIPSFSFDNKVESVSEVHLSYDYFPSSYYSFYLFSDLIDIRGNDREKISVSSLGAGVKLYLF